MPHARVKKWEKYVLVVVVHFWADVNKRFKYVRGMMDRCVLFCFCLVVGCNFLEHQMSIRSCVSSCIVSFNCMYVMYIRTYVRT